MQPVTCILSLHFLPGAKISFSAHIDYFYWKRKMKVILSLRNGSPGFRKLIFINHNKNLSSEKPVLGELLFFCSQKSHLGERTVIWLSCLLWEQPSCCADYSSLLLLRAAVWLWFRFRCFLALAFLCGYLYYESERTIGTVYIIRVCFAANEADYVI